ncbi:MAG: putative membrane-bound dehydrogenase-like protein [Arcticibacterium sp.]|jgi:putative membrane-bound dehydrogenase-like protein
MIRILITLIGVILMFSCNSNHQKLSDKAYNSLPEDDKRSAAYALEGIDLEDRDLELTLFASEPMMTNPTNMDIDARGRVWICEGYNYRNRLNPDNDYKGKGDRILILEDTDGDGKADKTTVFYQGEDINSALGIGVFGNRVIVSRSPYVFVFTDEDGDDIPDKKEVLFEGIGGEDHDHGMHAFTFGPDGKFYFNYGNAGNGLLTSKGKTLKDKQGSVINGEGKPYREGMVYRSDLDGSNVEILGWNFRNNYELAVDSYGLMWQSDNDDDGNRGTRVNYVMDYGNYGYKDEMTGEDWRTRRVNLEDSIPLRHWHLNDPGVVPNLLQNYAGSPTGILVYEGKLLPKRYQNQLIHTDAGPNVVRAYPVDNQGAGYSAKVLNILNGGKRDKWFRPSDLTVAPDGSLFISDWYDPAVGGHALGDTDKGRVYRLAPKGHKYQVNKPDFESIEGNLKALQSPNVATRYIAWNNLHDRGEDAEAALNELWETGESRMRARAFWLLSKLPQKGKSYIELAAKDSDGNIRIAAIRASREQIGADFSEFYLKLASDSSAQVRREVALAIRHEIAPKVWQKLAMSYKGGDRWFLEALGIGAEGQWDSYLTTYLKVIGEDWIKQEASLDIVWRSRSSRTLDLLGQIIKQEPLATKWRYYRAMDFQTKGDKNSMLMKLLAGSDETSEQVAIFRQLTLQNLDDYPKLKEEIGATMSVVGTEDFLDIVKKYGLINQKERLLDIIREDKEKSNIQLAANSFVDFYGMDEVRNYCIEKDTSLARNAIERFGLVDSEPITELLITLFQDDSVDISLRKEAMLAMNGWDSESRLWELIKAGEVPEDVMDIAKEHMARTWHQDIRVKASDFFGDKQVAALDVSKLLAMEGKVADGKVVFKTYCISCHVADGQGIDFGPALSQIGAKLGKEGLYKAILNPSEGIGFGYETQEIDMKDGTSFQAIITSKTEENVNIKLLGQSETSKYALKDIRSIKQLDVSLMPKYPLEEKQLVNLVGYLSSLK